VVVWFEKIKEWKSKGLKEAYFFIQSGSDNTDFRAIEEIQRFKELVEHS
jgi:hypothetical protein